MQHGYLHEVWMCSDPDGDGELLPACIALGPRGDAARALNSPGSVYVLVFWADSHFDAMTIYNQFLDREPYWTEQVWDYERYPDEWYDEQARFLENLST